MDRIQDYILEVAEPEQEMQAAPTTRKRPEVSYEIIAKTNTDVVIKRSTSKTESVLAIIPSKGQYYVTGGDGQAVSLTSESMTKFFSKMDEPLAVGLDWLSAIEKGKAFAEQFLKFVEKYRSAITAGLIDPAFFERTAERYYHDEPDLIILYDLAPKLALYLKEKKASTEFHAPIVNGVYSTIQPFACGAFEKYTGNRKIPDSLAYLYPMMLLFGLDKVKMYVDKMVERDINFGCSLRNFTYLIETLYQKDRVLFINGTDHLRADKEAITFHYSEIAKLRNDEHMNADAFISYCLSYQSEGYRDLDNFFSQLRDDWNMQRMVYGKIRDKYPQNMSSHHDRLSLKCAMIAGENDENSFAKQYEKAAEKEWADDSYIITPPKNTGEMVDEAIQQSNCLRSYIGKVIEGNCFIYFLRHKKAPNISLITIEVRGDMIIQVKGKFNRHPNTEQTKTVRKWADAKGLICAF